MDRGRLTPLLAVGSSALLLGACAVAPEQDGWPWKVLRWPGTSAAPEVPRTFESRDFIVTFAEWGDTPETLAARFLGDSGKAWVVEDYNGRAHFASGDEVVIPKRPWNLVGVDRSGYQTVPVLVYHKLGPRARGRLLIAVKTFEAHMRYLKSENYRVVSLADLYDFVSFTRQLPRRAVVLNFDDGYRSFLKHAYPILKELGFTATLFIYTDYVGHGSNALTWGEIRSLTREGFDVQAHSKTHEDLRRRPGESDEEYNRRLAEELGHPQNLFRRHLDRAATIFAYPYGTYDDELEQKVKEYGYSAAFGVGRGGNPSFVAPLRAHRIQIYSTISFEEFKKTLEVFRSEPLR